MRFRWFRHGDIFDVTSSEDDVFINVIFRRRWSICVPVLRPIGFNCWKNIKMVKIKSCLPTQHTVNIRTVTKRPLKEKARVASPVNPPLAKATVDRSVSTDDNIPSYRICALDIKLILLPMYGVPLMLAAKQKKCLYKFRIQRLNQRAAKKHGNPHACVRSISAHLRPL